MLCCHFEASTRFGSNYTRSDYPWCYFSNTLNCPQQNWMPVDIPMFFLSVELPHFGDWPACFKHSDPQNICRSTRNRSRKCLDTSRSASRRRTNFHCSAYLDRRATPERRLRDSEGKSASSRLQSCWALTRLWVRWLTSKISCFFSLAASQRGSTFKRLPFRCGDLLSVSKPVCLIMRVTVHERRGGAPEEQKKRYQSAKRPKRIASHAFLQNILELLHKKLFHFIDYGRGQRYN